MPSNVEIKARVADPERLDRRVAAIAGGPATVLEQEDIFFRTPAGRLKLRRLGEHHGELIYYERDDATGPTTSSYRVVPTSSPAELAELLRMSLGECGRVVKRRRLYLCGQTRVHLDDVRGLGSFMELEVVLREGQSPDEGRRIAQALMRRLEIADHDLVDVAYVDLLR